MDRPQNLVEEATESVNPREPGPSASNPSKSFRSDRDMFSEPTEALLKISQDMAQPVLKQMIVDAQKDDVELQKKVQLVRDGVKTDYSVKENGEVYYNNRHKEVKNKLLYEAHNTVFTMHPGGTKMYQDLKQYC